MSCGIGLSVTCAVCHGSPVIAKGLCRRCYQTARRRALGVMPRPSAEERFWSNVMPEPNSGCWLYLGTDQGKGYGCIRVDGVTKMAHRYAYELLVGPIPYGLTIDHLCRVHACVNPFRPHAAEPVTRGVNTLRGDTITAANLLKTHCPQGHPYDKENTQWVGNERRCHTCGNTRARLYQQKRRALQKGAV